MSEPLTFETLTRACRPGGASVLTAVTELRPAAGEHAGVAPARYVRGSNSTYAFGKRYVAPHLGEDAQAVDVVTIDGKGSSLNRVEMAITQAMRESEGPLAATPRIHVSYTGASDAFDLDLPHRAADGHVRAGTVDGKPVTETAEYRAIRDCTNANLKPLLEMSPASIAFGVWDSTRKSNQLRLRSCLIGETIGVLADQITGRDIDPRGGARFDSIAPSVRLAEDEMRQLLDAQRSELSDNNIRKIEDEIKKAKAKKGSTSASSLGLGAIPPSLEELGLGSCSRIIRSHVLSFSALRQLRFGLGAGGDVAARALLAAWALNGLVRSYGELTYRANCDLTEAGAPAFTMDARYGRTDGLAVPEIEDVDALLQQAIDAARAHGVRWEGQTFEVAGNPIVARGAVDEEAE